MQNIITKSEIRNQIRKQRQLLSPESQVKYAEQALKIVIDSNILNNNINIAVYISNDNELSLQPVIEYCLINNINCYFPVLNNEHLNFVKYSLNSKFKKNKYNIPEPIANNTSDYIKAQNLDLVFMPLVAFTKSGQRLGMGGGFYDRTFAFLANPVNNNIDPQLIGVAYDLQRVEFIPKEQWDININGIITEKEFIKF